MKQDKNAKVIVCGDFNKQLPIVARELQKLKFTAAFNQGTVTHKQGGHLDQVFVKNLTIRSAATNNGYIDEVSDHKSLRVTLKL